MYGPLILYKYFGASRLDCISTIRFTVTLLELETKRLTKYAIVIVDEENIEVVHPLIVIIH